MLKSAIRIATWNCNGALRKKWHHLLKVQADVYIVQECEDPMGTKDLAYREWAESYLWTGASKHKGLGVFASAGISLKTVEIDVKPLELFLPCTVGENWPLLAVWTKQANSPNFRYIGQLWKFLQCNREFLRHPEALLVGDLNSNTIWDEWDRWWNHSDVVRELSELGLQSCYHRYFSEAQGEETRPTFFMQRKPEKPYHIDYGFAGSNWTVRCVKVGSAVDWLKENDHLPVVFDLERTSQA